MQRIIAKFVNDEGGAVTVDWVVLTAGVVGLAIMAWTTIDTQTTTLGSAAGTAVGAQNDF